MERSKSMYALGVGSSERRVLVSWLPHHGDFFVAGSDDLQLYEASRAPGPANNDGGEPGSRSSSHRVYRLRKSVSVPHLTCLQCYPHEAPPFLVAAGTHNGRVQLVNFKLSDAGGVGGGMSDSRTATAGLDSARAVVVQTFLPKTVRPCSTVAWNRRSPSQIAVGLEKLRSDPSLLIYDINSSSYERAAGGLNSLSLELGGSAGAASTPRPFASLAVSEGVISVAWKLNVPHVLVYGTASRRLIVHDLRGNAPASALSIGVYPRSLQGLSLDPWNHDVVATYSSDAGESVKIWDLRKVDISNPEPAVTLRPLQRKPVSSVAWSSMREGVLAVTLADDPVVSLYDLREPSAPFQSRVASGGAVMSVSWKPASAAKEVLNLEDAKDMEWDELLDRAVPNRVLVATRQGFEELSVHEYKPLAVSRAGGLLLGCGRILVNYSLAAHVRGDPSVVMRERAQAGYSTDVGRNIQVMTDDAESLAPLENEEALRLGRMWAWVDRIEELCLQDATGGWGSSPAALSDNDWPVSSMMDAGVLSMLEMMGGYKEAEGVGGKAATGTIGPELGCAVYGGRGRRAALRACGWSAEGDEGVLLPEGARRPGLGRIMMDCEAVGHYERSAALAVFHGDIRAAVSALQRGAESIMQRIHEEEAEALDTRLGNKSVEGLSLGDIGGPDVTYAEVLQLVAMCLAGYSHVATTAASSSSSSRGATGLWRDMAQALLDRPVMSSSSSRPGVAYLRAAVGFLASIAETIGTTSRPGVATPDKVGRRATFAPDPMRMSSSGAAMGGGVDSSFRRVLLDTELSLADRVAFACQYLPARQLQAYLRQQAESCMAEGNLEGMILFGLSRDGIKLLQAYVDRTSDVQTAALLTSRLPIPAARKHEQALAGEWTEAYRELLNSGQLWHERALFDVGRSNMLNEAARRMKGIRGGGGDGNGANDAPAPVPAQLFVRCNFCNTAIPLSSLRRQGRMNQSWLSRQKPLLSCCPDCRKPLPRCYICLMPMGSINPYLELRRQVQMQQASGKDATEELLNYEAMASLSGIRFPEWFTWCQRCRHGGHAHHILDWFDTHDQCGVAGCTCRCYALDACQYGGQGDVGATRLGEPSSTFLLRLGEPSSTFLTTTVTTR